MPKFSVAKSITIQAPPETVESAVTNFRTWPKWSPWLICDPEAVVEYAEDGRGYSWNGPVVGSGSMALLDSPSAGVIRYDLQFLKPWKSQADVRFDLKSTRDGTEATWVMDSSLPLFMFWMKKMMVAMIGMDYDRGLAMLKDWVETDDVPSELEFRPDVEVPATAYVGIKTHCSMSDMGARMEADVAELMDWAKTSGTQPSGPLFTTYHEWSIGKGETCYTTAMPVRETPKQVPETFHVGHRPTMNTYVIAHTGPYRHLANAWSAGILRSRSKVFQQSKGQHPFEIYERGPNQSGPLELLTTIHFPVK